MIALFFLIADGLYVVWNLIDSDWVSTEWVGTVGLGLCAILGVFIASYLTLTHRAQGGELAEDRLDANIDDGDPEIGYFSPWSWWPMTVAAGLALMFMGLAFAVWLMFVGAPIVLVGVLGWYYEYYRGNFAR